MLGSEAHQYRYNSHPFLHLQEENPSQGPVMNFGKAIAAIVLAIVATAANTAAGDVPVSNTKNFVNNLKILYFGEPNFWCSNSSTTHHQSP